MTEFLNMGGYADYVWSSFALTAIVLIVNFVAARRLQDNAIREVRGRIRRQSSGSLRG